MWHSRFRIYIPWDGNVTLYTLSDSWITYITDLTIGFLAHLAMGKRPSSVRPLISFSHLNLLLPIVKRFTNLVQDHPMIIPAKSQSNWLSGFWQDDFLNFSQWEHIMDPGVSFLAHLAIGHVSFCHG
jgi:hypothetical protein